MTGFAWLQKNDPDYKERQPREITMSPGALTDLIGSFGLRKEYGIHRQSIVLHMNDEEETP